MQEQPDVIIIRGAPASGKSQTAKSLAQLLPSGVRLEVDTLRNMVISVDWTNQKEHIGVLEASTKLVDGFLNMGLKPVIVVDTFSGDKVKGFTFSLKQIRPNISIKSFALYTTDEELKKRTDARPEGEFKDYEICRKLNASTIKFKYDGEHHIDTTETSIENVANKIYEYLK